jgi:hypothetical protein
VTEITRYIFSQRRLVGSTKYERMQKTENLKREHGDIFLHCLSILPMFYFYGEASSRSSIISPRRRLIALSVGVGDTLRQSKAPIKVATPPKRRTHPTPVLPRYVFSFPGSALAPPSTILNIKLVTMATLEADLERNRQADESVQ